jgi:hypothetical protein
MKTLRDILSYLVLNEYWRYEYQKPQRDPQKVAAEEVTGEARMKHATTTRDNLMKTVAGGKHIAVVTHSDTPTFDTPSSDAYLVRHQWGGDMEDSLMYVLPGGKAHKVERLDASPTGFITVWGMPSSGGRNRARKPIGHINASMGHQDKMGLVLPKEKHMVAAKKSGKKHHIKIEI